MSRGGKSGGPQKRVRVARRPGKLKNSSDGNFDSEKEALMLARG
jgi:hypothetical protein